MEPRPLRDRREAGRLLAEQLRGYAGRDDVIVLALPRGGVPVAYEIAEALGAPLDVFLVRKLGVPGHEELALGAIATGGIRVVNGQLVDALGMTTDEVEAVAARELSELERRERAYRGDSPPPDVTGKTVILVDDGLATGSSMWAAVLAVRADDPARVVVAVPVADPDVCERFRGEADAVVCLMTPKPLRSVGSWYEDFEQTTDDEVRELLAKARRRGARRRGSCR
jgi:predicted phosphoribosyltransferase